MTGFMFMKMEQEYMRASTREELSFLMIEKVFSGLQTCGCNENQEIH